ncbi:MAG TPA: 4'-phosphopantetheinyl transferase superfamily protein [Actinospica sp.]|jgi:4'-phosphopantetheinyl transferase|nr:4'-phosphopantetheinyl transferase superfamily protein [Actinospica sp.]
MTTTTARYAGLAAVRLEVDRPLAVHHVPGPLTLAVVSIGWLRSLDALSRSAVAARHLDADEVAHAAALPVPKRKLEWLAGRLAVKHAVSRHRMRQTGECPATRDVHVTTAADGPCAGRPLVNAPVHISVSHSADFAIAACGPQPVGVDLERSGPLPPLVTQLLAHDETATDRPVHPGLAAMPAALRWTCKEAVLKLFGFGLRVDTREVRLTGWHDDGRFTWTSGTDLCRRAPDAADPSAFATWAHEIDGYCLALIWK